jgi:hypothetical protein
MGAEGETNQEEKENGMRQGQYSMFVAAYRYVRIMWRLESRRIRKRSKCACTRTTEDMTCLDCGKNPLAEAW